METKENKMGVMPINRLVFNMSLPLMISLLVQSLYNIVDSIFVARISENALTATSICYSAQMLQIAFAVGTAVGLNALISRKLGEKRYDDANEATTTGLFLCILTSLVFVLWGVFGTRAFIALFTSDGEILDLGTSYLRICQLFCTGLFLGTYTQRILQATGRTFSSMVAQVTGAVINIILDPILIFGMFGFPEMGITGAAVATVLGQWIAAIIGFILNAVQNHDLHFVFRGYKLNRQSIVSIYTVGAPTILTQAFGSIMISLMNSILIAYSSSAVAFFGVYFKLQSFVFMPMNGLGQGAMPIVGYNLGAKNKERIMETRNLTLRVGVLIALLGSAIFLVFPKQLLLLFSAEGEMLTIGVTGLRIISVTFAFGSITMIIGYLISGLGNGTVNMVGTALRQIVVLIPFTILFGMIGGINMCWFAFWVSEVAACIYAIIMLRREFKKKVDIIEPVTE